MEKILKYLIFEVGFIIWAVGFINYYYKTIYLDMYYSWSWETPLAFIWFIWFPIKWLYYKLKKKDVEE